MSQVIISHKDLSGQPDFFSTIMRDISKRKAAEEKLASTEKQFRALIENSTDCLTLYDSQGVVIYISPSMERITGRKPDEVIGTRYGSKRHPDDVALARAAFDAVLHDPAHPQTVEFRTQHNDGSWRWVETTLSNRLDDANIRAIVSNRRDITARKLAEAGLASAERRYRALIENSADSIALLDAHGTILYRSPSATRITGRTPQERVGAGTGQFHHPDDASIVPDAIAALLRDPESIQRVELRTAHIDGAWRWIEATLTNRLGDPNVQAIVSNYRDITARKHAEAIAQASSSLIETTMNSLPLEIAVLDGEGTILSVNRAWREFAEANSADLNRVSPGANYLSFCTGADSAASNEGTVAAAGLSAVLAGTLERFEFAYRCETPAGSRFFACHAAPIRNHPQARMVVVHEDTTERTEAEEKLHQVNEEIQQLYEVARTLHGSSDLQAMGETILNQALNLSACDLGVIRLREDADAPIRVIARHGYRDAQNLQRHTKSAAGPNSEGASRPRDRMRAFELDQTTIVERIDASDRMATFHREGICSLISIPVTVGATIHCVMQLGSRSARRFEPRLVRLLETLAHDFGIATQKVHLLQQALADQERLRELSRRVVAAQETERRDIARELHDEIGSLLSALKIMIKLDGGDTAQSLAVDRKSVV